MKPKPKTVTTFDLENENFNYFFHKLSALMVESQREVLPKDLYFKLFKRGGDYDSKSSNKISFLGKIFILIKALRKRMIIIVEDEKEGMSIEEFFKYKDLVPKRNYSTQAAVDLIDESVFVLGSKELVDTYSYLNHLSTSPAYNYLIKAKNVDASSKSEEEYSRTIYICRFLQNYESVRKKITMTTGITMSEWLILISCYDGNELHPANLYNHIFRHSYNSSRTKLKVAYGTLYNKALIDRIGYGRFMKIRITALGKDKVNEILKNLVVNV